MVGNPVRDVDGPPQSWVTSVGRQVGWIAHGHQIEEQVLEVHAAVVVAVCDAPIRSGQQAAG